MFSLESPHRGDSSEYTQHTIINIKKKTILNIIMSTAMGLFHRDWGTGLKQQW